MKTYTYTIPARINVDALPAAIAARYGWRGGARRLAQEAGIHRVTISNLLRGRTSAGPAVTAKLVAVLGVGILAPAGESAEVEE